MMLSDDLLYIEEYINTVVWKINEDQEVELVSREKYFDNCYGRKIEKWRGFCLLYF